MVEDELVEGVVGVGCYGCESRNRSRLMDHWARRDGDRVSTHTRTGPVRRMLAENARERFFAPDVSFSAHTCLYLETMSTQTYAYFLAISGKSVTQTAARAHTPHPCHPDRLSRPYHRACAQAHTLTPLRSPSALTLCASPDRAVVVAEHVSGPRTGTHGESAGGRVQAAAAGLRAGGRLRLRGPGARGA